MTDAATSEPSRPASADIQFSRGETLLEKKEKVRFIGPYKGFTHYMQDCEELRVAEQVYGMAPCDHVNFELPMINGEVPTITREIILNAIPESKLKGPRAVPDAGGVQKTAKRRGDKVRFTITLYKCTERQFS